MGDKGCPSANNSKKGEAKTGCVCPYCEGPVEMQYPFCQACQATLKACQKCQKPIGKEDEVCPHCGAEIE